MTCLQIDRARFHFRPIAKGLLFVLLFVIPSHVAALHRSWEFTVQGGQQRLFSDSDIVRANDQQVDYRDPQIAGLIVTNNFTRVVGIEISTVWGLSESTTPTFTPLQRLTLSSNRFGLIFHLREGILRPFFTLDAGFRTGSRGAFVQEAVAPKTEIEGMGGFGAGLKIDLLKWLGLRGDVKLNIVDGYRAESTTDVEWRAGLVVGWSKKTGDRDGDGIPDTIDRCPTNREDLDGFDDDDGCPDYDNDQDNIDDRIDRCPSLPEDVNKFQDDDGCPDSAIDADNDGIPDRQDRCPNVAEDIDQFEDKDGCPEGDNDSDGVDDAVDQCPTEKETTNGYKEDDGCPDRLPAAVQQFSETIPGIAFETGSSDIKSESTTALDRAVEVLEKHPSLVIIVVGHTDSVGNHDFNMQLSFARAKAVKGYLVEHGIVEKRIVVKGYGPDQPIATNSTEAGRSKNRRIEFRVVSLSDEAQDQAD